MMLLAEIADKMPTVEVMWTQMFLIAGVCSLFTAVATMAWRHVGLVPVFLAGIISLFLVSPDPLMDPPIVKELGSSYLYQQRLSACLPLICTLFTWLIVMWFVPRLRMATQAP